MEAEPFQKNLWSAELVLKEHSPDSLVYPCENIFLAFNVSESLETLKLLKHYANSIEGASEQIELLTKSVENFVAQIKQECGYQSKNGEFDVMDYLDSTSITVSKLKEEYDEDYLCWPRSERISLEPCFKHYHVYKFHEKYMDQIPNGIEVFLKLIPDLEPFIVSAMITDNFYWNHNNVKFLYDYEEAVEGLQEMLAERRIQRLNKLK